MSDRTGFSVSASRPWEVRGASRRNSRQGSGRGKKALPWKRVLQVSVSLFLLVGLVASMPWLMNWLNQPIARVEVHAGFEHLSREQVERALHPHLQERFFALDLVEMQQVLLAMPWVKSASVRRQWPDGVLVSLKEQQPVARWGRNHLISNEGEVFAPEDFVGFSAMPVLDGHEEMAAEVMQQYLAISQLLRPIGLKLTMLKRSNSGSWRFTVGHVEVNIGRDRRMERLQRFVRLYHARLETRWNQVRRVDLRYLNGASVAWGETLVKARSK
ncbi:cell division protein FtsQ/DivIB [Endozoicomonas sp. SESOKO1]|uniref:cell division protein FtsQ/DivIB n=1 Tax=Endozoicomonas sp. SESOKO1 TaxID=2828742 RepID=UPI002147B054|nr:cell division protein FtsQ/DivIB [Endozoicomonas sp. SESOKO1]